MLILFSFFLVNEGINGMGVNSSKGVLKALAPLFVF
jgi:hypothetical protein